MKILNAFSLNMITAPAKIMVSEISLEEARIVAAGALESPTSGLESAVGHAPTAAIFSQQLGVPVATNRATITLKKGEMALVGQYRGPRLEEGATTLPAGATIQWYLVTDIG